MEVSRQKYEESLLVTNGEVEDVDSEVSGPSSASSKPEEIPEIVVDPVDDGREVSIQPSYWSRSYNPALSLVEMLER